MNYSDTVKQIKDKSGLTHRELAEQAGVTKRTWLYWLQGRSPDKWGELQIKKMSKKHLT